MLKIPVLFNEKMVCRSGCMSSPSAHKPAEVMQEWRKLFPNSIEEILSAPVSVSELSLAHDENYVRNVLNCLTENGFGNTSPAVAESLPFTSGAMLGAARQALINGKVAVAPVSGFHHACHAFGGGFCTFNGLMVTAMSLLNEDKNVARVGILDLDQHYGKGTDDIIRTLGLNENTLRHYTAGGKRNQAESFLQELPTLMATVFEGCDILLYQAGADPHIKDPLGGWMTNEQLAERDSLVFRTAKNMGMPVAWDLAGGYQTPLQKVLDIHNNTMQACIRTYLE